PPEVPCLADELPGSRRVGVSLHLEHDRCPPIAEPHDAIDTVIASHRRSCLDCLDPGHAPKQLERHGFQLLIMIYYFSYIHSTSKYRAHSEDEQVPAEAVRSAISTASRGQLRPGDSLTWKPLREWSHGR